MTRPARARWIPFNRQQMTSPPSFGWPTLPMAARQAHCSHLPDVSLFRYFILPDCNRSGDHRTGTQVTSVSGQVKILFSHSSPRSAETDLLYINILGVDSWDIWSVLLGLPRWQLTAII